MKVEILGASDSACDTFVAGRSDAKIGHMFAWSDAVARAARLRAFYLVARDGQTVRGVLPLMHAKSMIFGNFMVSQAFSDYGGPLADSPDVRDALFNRAVELATTLKCDSIEFRNLHPLPYDLQLRTGKMCMYVPLAPDPDDVWKSFKPQIRTHVRKAEKSGIVATQGHLELLDDFYSVYTTRMHQLGTPSYSRKLMRNLLQSFPDNSRLFVVRLNDVSIGGALTFCFNGFVEGPLASTLTQYNSLGTNNLLNWSVIKHYCLAGANCFDFGRSTVESPTYRFKKQWGAEPVDLHYQYWVRPGHQLSVLSPDNPKFQKRIEMWRKLPLWFARLISPMISRNLP